MPHLSRFLSLFITSSFSLIFSINLDFSYSNSNPPSSPFILAIMVEFQEDNNPMTSGDGLFLDSLEIDMVSNPNTSRCDQFILDRPPHDSLYFSHQIEAVANYYNKVSNNI